MDIREVFSVVDLHVAGDPVRVIVSGYPPIRGKTIRDKTAYLKTHLDHYRQHLIFEPWGHANMLGCLLVEPEREDSAYGLIFMDRDGYRVGDGHGIIGVATFLVDTGRLTVDSEACDVPIRFDVDGGQVTAHLKVHESTAERISVLNDRAFVVAEHPLVMEDTETVTVILAFGGALYAMVDSEQLNLSITAHNVDELRQWAMRIGNAFSETGSPTHPWDAWRDRLKGVIFTDGPSDPTSFSKTLVVGTDGQVIRSGASGALSAAMAIWDYQGLFPRNQPYAVEGLEGAIRYGRVLGEDETIGAYPSVRTTIEGQAYCVAFRRFFVNPEDTLGPFLIR